jgi:hypothetical protein
MVGRALLWKDVLAEGGAEAKIGRRSVVACKMGGGGNGGGGFTGDFEADSGFAAGFASGFAGITGGCSLLLMAKKQARTSTYRVRSNAVPFFNRSSLFSP